jgi:hypothetical protein
LLIYAGAGAPAESLRAAVQRVERQVTRETEPERRLQVLTAVLYQPGLLAFPQLPPPAGALRINQAEAALARGDKAMARSVLADLAEQRAWRLAGGAADHVLLEARLLAMAGDSAAARARLESLLDDLPALPSDLFEWATQAAAVSRAMAYYGQVGGDARGRGVDSALAALWKHADATLRARRDP